jgi:hypothetical protein
LSKAIPHEKATAEWLQRTSPEAGPSRSIPIQQSGVDPIPQTKNAEPNPKDFLIPSTPEEHKSIVDRLILGGSLRSEAEQTIANRKAAFNKAVRIYKKNLPKNKAANKRRSFVPDQSSFVASESSIYHDI